MKLGEITIIIELDESKLSDATKKAFDLSDTDPFKYDSPFESGFDTLIGGLEAKVQNTLAYKYLGDSEKAISLRLVTC
jgi:hypothetical protein